MWLENGSQDQNSGGLALDLRAFNLYTILPEQPSWFVSVQQTFCKHLLCGRLCARPMEI